ncbi:MAG TPA: carboxypeptidase-like regulatory domain-containing protein [Gemmatimonadaceae bacterium]|nr:carboxypeptidase-like regulatory domain-containing protein [Gemmatimonadaceae bacterium]
MASCGLSSEDCDTIQSVALAVKVTDANSGQPLTSGVTVVARGPSYDSVTTMSVSAFQVGDRPGTYTIVVRKAGYRDYVQDGVRVPDSGSCNRPVTQVLTVALQPQ